MIIKIVEEKKKRYDELHDLLADPKVIANRLEHQGYAKEMSALTGLINEYNTYQRISKDLHDIEKVLKDKGHDKDFIVLAEEEHQKLKEELAAKEKALAEMGQEYLLVKKKVNLE